MTTSLWVVMLATERQYFVLFEFGASLLIHPLDVLLANRQLAFQTFDAASGITFAMRAGEINVGALAIIEPGVNL